MLLCACAHTDALEGIDLRLPKKTKRFLWGLLVAACIGGILCIAFYFNLLSSVQLQSTDFLFKTGDLRQNANPVADIVIVGIDEKSLAQLGHFPSWSRANHAKLIDILAKANARVIVFDILFAELAPGDEELVESIKNAGNVILPMIYSSAQQEPLGVSEAVSSGSFIRPLPYFEENALAVGHANMLPDEDGVIRRVPLIINAGGETEPGLSLTATAKFLRRPEVIESPIENSQLKVAGRSIPLDNANQMIINYTAGSTSGGETATFNTVSYVDVLGGLVDPAIFNDKIVLIGATATGLGDIFWTPMGHQVAGVQIHANAINTILTGNFLHLVSRPVTFALIVVLALLCGLLVLRLRILWAIPSIILICIAYFLIAFAFFDRGSMLNMVYPPLAIVGSFLGVNIYNIAAERSEKNEITKTFGRYVSPPVVTKILTALEKDELRLGGEQCEVTVAFADVRGFTSMSENIEAEELVRALNIYLSIVIREVQKQDGIINKFGGDSIMAVWNVPTACKEHALRATVAAIEAQRAIKELQQRDANLLKMDFRIGINTGVAVAGNLGSQDRLEYSVIGDTVNVASRLTALADSGRVWIGSSTYELVKDHVMVKELEPLTVKGKREAIKAYEVVDMSIEGVN
jgi:adenylate cyclase